MDASSVFSHPVMTFWHQLQPPKKKKKIRAATACFGGRSPTPHVLIRHAFHVRHTHVHRFPPLFMSVRGPNVQCPIRLGPAPDRYVPEAVYLSVWRRACCITNKKRNACLKRCLLTHARHIPKDFFFPLVSSRDRWLFSLVFGGMTKQVISGCGFFFFFRMSSEFFRQRCCARIFNQDAANVFISHFQVRHEASQRNRHRRLTPSLLWRNRR